MSRKVQAPSFEDRVKSLHEKGFLSRSEAQNLILLHQIEVREKCAIAVETAVTSRDERIREQRTEIAQLSQTIQYLHDEIDTVREQKDKLKQIEPKTGCLNQKFFEEDVLFLTLQRACSNRRHDDRRSPWISLWYIDMHQFKWINEKLGHQVGDEVLKTFGKLLRQGIRFIEKEDFPARMGGDEFAVLMRHVSDVEIPYLTAKRLSERVQLYDWTLVDSRFEKHRDLQPKCDIGIVCLKQNSMIGCTNPEIVQVKMLKLAEELMKEHKQKGGDIYVRNVEWSSSINELEDTVVDDYFVLRPENERRHQAS